MKNEDDGTIEKCLRKFNEKDWIDVLFKNPNSGCLWYLKLWLLKYREYRRRSKPFRKHRWNKYIEICTKMIKLIEKCEGVDDTVKKLYEEVPKRYKNLGDQ